MSKKNNGTCSVAQHLSTQVSLLQRALNNEVSGTVDNGAGQGGGYGEISVLRRDTHPIVIVTKSHVTAAQRAYWKHLESCDYCQKHHVQKSGVTGIVVVLVKKVLSFADL